MFPGIHICQEDKEGDDAIAYAVRMRQPKSSVVLSGDKDLWSLLQYPGCTVYSPNLKRFVTKEDLLDHYSVQEDPNKVYLAKSLFGDSSDGIVGCKGLFKAHVADLINNPNIKTPEDFYQELPGFFEEIKASKKKKVMTQNTYDKLIVSEQAVKTNYKVILPQLDFDKSSVKVVKGSVDKLKEKLLEFECFTLLPKIDQLFG